MRSRENIDEILEAWPYEPNALSVRIRPGKDGRDVIQMRLDLGLLQMETVGRPDGTRPHDSTTFLEHITAIATAAGEEFTLDEEQCEEADREFVQYYHRRLCWLALREFGKAMLDADHTLNLMDFCRDHSPDDDWTTSHEQYRPFVLFHRTQAAALAELESGNGAESAVQAVNEGLDRLRQVFTDHGLEEDFESDELVSRLIDMREMLRQQFEVGRTLEERLNDAVAAEQYEIAAKLRDELTKRRGEGGR